MSIKLRFVELKSNYLSNRAYKVNTHAGKYNRFNSLVDWLSPLGSCGAADQYFFDKTRREIKLYEVSK